jgi:hypothetical protein
VDYGPLTVDPAAMDVSLMIDTCLVAGEDWMRLADEVYELEALRAPAVPPRPERDAANPLDALHYIRQTAFAVQFSDAEYPIASHCSCFGRRLTMETMPRAKSAGCMPTVSRTGSSVNWPTNIAGWRTNGRPRMLRKARFPQQPGLPGIDRVLIKDSLSSAGGERSS